MHVENIYPSISKLPSELLSIIFEHYQQIQPLAPTAEITLSQISRLWRDIALYTPRIWNRLSITFHTPPEKVDAYLRRSADQSLQVSVDFGHSDGQDSTLSASDIFLSICGSHLEGAFGCDAANSAPPQSP